MTNGSSNVAIGSGASNAPAGDDVFASMLGSLVQTPNNDMAKAAAPSAPADDADLPDTSGEAAANPTTLAFQTLLPLQEAAPQQSAATQIPPSDTSDDAGTTLASLTAPSTDTSGSLRGANSASRLAKGFRSDPARADRGHVTPANGDATPAAETEIPPATAADTMLAQMAAAQQAVAASNVPTATPETQAAAPANASADPVQMATDAANAPMTTAPATDVAAAAVLTGGATAKPADDKAASTDNEKTQEKSTTAAALADTAKAARVFTDQKVSAAHALPLNGSGETPRNGNHSGDTGSGQQNPQNMANPASAPAPAADTPAASAPFTPSHAQAPAQPDASAVAANSATATAPTATVAANAPAQAAAQLQVSHPQTAATPDLNSLAFNIATKSEGGARHFDIRLDPAELGRVDVRLTVDDAGKAQATLSVEKPQTLELLQKDQTHLERALKDAGLDLSQNGLSFSLKGQQQQAGNNGGNTSSSRGRTRAVRAIAAADAVATNLSLSGVASGDTRLDIRV